MKKGRFGITVLLILEAVLLPTTPAAIRHPETVLIFQRNKKGGMALNEDYDGLGRRLGSDQVCGNEGLEQSKRTHSL